MLQCKNQQQQHTTTTTAATTTTTITTTTTTTTTGEGAQAIATGRREINRNNSLVRRVYCSTSVWYDWSLYDWLYSQFGVPLVFGTTCLCTTGLWYDQSLRYDQCLVRSVLYDRYVVELSFCTTGLSYNRPLRRPVFETSNLWYEQSLLRAVFVRAVFATSSLCYEQS